MMSRYIQIAIVAHPNRQLCDGEISSYYNMSDHMHSTHLAIVWRWHGGLGQMELKRSKGQVLTGVRRSRELTEGDLPVRPLQNHSTDRAQRTLFPSVIMNSSPTCM